MLTTTGFIVNMVFLYTYAHSLPSFSKQANGWRADSQIEVSTILTNQMPKLPAE